ncbi:MAG: hypothetical protein AB8B46_01790 [Candidatus Midichloriaceae bacterium]
MSFICESGIGHAIGEIAETGFNIFTNYNYPIPGYILHEFIVEPAIDYIICYQSQDPQKIIGIINNSSLQNTTLYMAEFYTKYQASVAVNNVIAWYLGVITVPITPAIILVASSAVIITTQLISSAFSYIPSIIDDISLFDNNMSFEHLDTGIYIHPCAPRYGTDIFYQNFTEVENEIFILLQDLLQDNY